MMSLFKLQLFLVLSSVALAAPLSFGPDHQALLSNETISGIPKATQEIQRVRLEEVYHQTKFSTANTMLVFYLKTKKKAYAFDEVAYLKIEKY
jgi:TolA-binding protein